MIVTGCMDVRREWKGTMDINGNAEGKKMGEFGRL